MSDERTSDCLFRGSPYQETPTMRLEDISRTLKRVNEHGFVPSAKEGLCLGKWGAENKKEFCRVCMCGETIVSEIKAETQPDYSYG